MQSNVNLTGIYRFYLDGELVGEQKNALTVAGRSIIIKSLLGIIPDFADVIAYGIDGTPNTLNSASTLITNNTLGFEIGRTPVVGGSFKLAGTNDSLVYSGTIVDQYQYNIYEVGLYPALDNNESLTVEGETLYDFDLIDRFVKYGTYFTSASLTTTPYVRIGTQMLSIPQGDGTTNYMETTLDTSAMSLLKTYSSQDLFKLALFNNGSSGASVYFRFYTDDSNHYTVPFVSTAASGYKIISVEKGTATITGTPDWQTINKLRIWSAGSTPVILDAMKIDVGSYFLDTTFGMISRATLPAPIFKPASIPLTIEYSLIVNFSGGV